MPLAISCTKWSCSSRNDLSALTAGPFRAPVRGDGCHVHSSVVARIEPASAVSQLALPLDPHLGDKNLAVTPVVAHLEPGFGRVRVVTDDDLKPPPSASTGFHISSNRRSTAFRSSSGGGEEEVPRAWLATSQGWQARVGWSGMNSRGTGPGHARRNAGAGPGGIPSSSVQRECR